MFIIYIDNNWLYLLNDDDDVSDKDDIFKRILNI